MSYIFAKAVEGVSETGTFEIPFPPAETYNALIFAINQISAFKILSSNDLTRSIFIKTAASWKSWGEKINVSVMSSTNESFSKIAFKSKSNFAIKDWGKNEENITLLLDMLSKELQK